MCLSFDANACGILLAKGASWFLETDESADALWKGNNMVCFIQLV